jgi:hypothetical protein
MRLVGHEREESQLVDGQYGPIPVERENFHSPGHPLVASESNSACPQFPRKFIYGRTGQW